MNNKFKSIKTQFLSFFTIIMLVTLSIVGCVICYQVTEQAKKDYLNNSNEQMESVNNSINIFYDAVDRNINMLASNPIVNKADNSITKYKDNAEVTQMTPSRNGGIEEEMYDIFKQYGESHKGTLYVYVAAKDSGYVQWPEANASKNYDPVKRNWYQDAINANGTIIRTPPYIDSATNNMVSSNVRSITDKNGNTLGVVGIDVEQTVISNMLNSMKVGETGFYMLIHNSGFIMADGKNVENNFKQVKELNIQGLDNLLSMEGKLNNVNINKTKYIGNSKKIENSDLILVSFVEKNELMAGATRTMYVIIIVSIIMVIIAFALINIITKQITIPIIEASEYLQIIAKGDFSKQINSKHLLRKDEIGVIVNGINDMKNSLIRLINKIKGESSAINIEVNNVKNNINALNESLEEISATTEELSAGMEETSAASQEMIATSHEIEESVEVIAQKSEDGAKSAGEISRRAKSAKDNFNSSQERTHEIFISTKDQLEKAMEKSKVVDQINILAESIMDITEQTNLLALNAAIEAARAGDVGKGFAVVADEIKKLAEQSKDTVSKIQEITSSVIDAVSKLSSSSSNLLEFMSKDVDNDYNIMIEVAEQYNKDAEFMHELVIGFKNTAEKLENSIGGILLSIDGVAQSANEGANGTVDIANQVYNLNSKSNEVVEQALKAKESADKLKNETARFIIE